MMQLQINGDRAKAIGLQKPTYLIGQSAACNIQLPDESLQPVHACLKVQGDRIRLLRQEDAQIKINGQPLDEEAWVGHGDTISLGSTNLSVVDTARLGDEGDDGDDGGEEATPGAADASRTSADRPERKQPRDEQAQRRKPERSESEVEGSEAVDPEQTPKEGWVLRGISAALGGKTYLIKGKAVVGRARDCDIQLGEAHLSRHHAEVTPTASGLELNDLDSANGTYVNGRRIMQATLRNGDEVSFDTLKFRIFHADAQQHEETTVRSATPEFRPPQQPSGLPTAIEVQHATLRRLREERGQPSSGVSNAIADNKRSGGWMAATLAVIVLAGVIWGASWYFQPNILG